MLTEDPYPIRFWDAPDSTQIGESIEEFLEQFDGPTWIYIPGHDPGRCRVVSTLLHGNEPSGLHAIHQWLLSDDVPATDIYCFIGAPVTAQQQPYFHYRMLPGHRDLNRCFRPPFNDDEGQVAADLLHRLCAVQPEAVIDIHNTSGAGPSFAIATNANDAHRAVAALFTTRLIITDIRLGALMEFDSEPFTVTTIECGGAHDPKANSLACEGFERFVKTENLFDPGQFIEMDFYQSPVRVELSPDHKLTFSYEPKAGFDLILRNDIERYNFNPVTIGTELGWLGPAQMACLIARDAHGNEHTRHFFETKNGKLVARQNIKLFMVTTNYEIACSDCLFYVVTIDEPGHFEHLDTPPPS